jgi:WhiB family redox-sensing transcriptional regulator
VLCGGDGMTTTALRTRPLHLVLADLAEAPLGWMAFAVCDESSADLFFPEPGGQVKSAKAICRTCPVATECREYQLAYERTHPMANHLQGVFGGMSARERQDILAAERRREEVAA